MIGRMIFAEFGGHPDGPGFGDLVGNADKLAAAGHAGQVDKQGRPYVEAHLYPVASLAVRLAAVLLPDKADEVAALALLHDYIEDVFHGDIEAGAAALRAAGFDEEFIGWCVVLTHRRGDDRHEYIIGAVAEPVPALVKLADNLHNSHPDSLNALPLADGLRLCGKYRQDRDTMASVYPWTIDCGEDLDAADLASYPR